MTKKILMLCLSLFAVNGLHAQLTTTELAVSDDSYTDSENGTTNFGTDTLLYSGTNHFTSGEYYHRTFLYFDLSTIPSNATIESAEIRMVRSEAISGSNAFKTKLVTTSWGETTITNANQPTISTVSADIVTGSTNSGDSVFFDVTTIMNNIQLGLKDYEGWSIQVTDEASMSKTGVPFYTRESKYEANWPVLVVNYYIPIELTNVVIAHESDSAAADASIDLDLLYGSQDFTYEWLNSSGTVISTDTILDSIGYGWYGLHVTGSGSDELYYAFLIGTQCRSVDISFETSGDYTDVAYVHPSDHGGVDRASMNFSNTLDYMAREWNWTGTYVPIFTFDKIKLWMDDAFTVEKADYQLTGRSHYISNWRTNETEFKTVTENWLEEGITYNSQPNISDTISVELDSMSAIRQNNTADLTDFWNYWKQDNTNNYGMRFQIRDLDSSALVSVDFYTPKIFTTSSRPLIEFTLNLTPTNYVTASWDEDTELGEIVVDLDPLCIANTPPYFYFISTDTILDLDSLYGFYTDTIIGIDSTTFYSMSTIDLHKTYSNLESGHYHVTVFDKFGTRIVEEAFHLMSPLTFETQTNKFNAKFKAQQIGK